ncbi:MAG: hypothetical protein M1837_006947 [Sclerophora amabilis]|nr:MAG: hypothetical protein M1837_006947 [Sclerophora amabilis]
MSARSFRADESIHGDDPFVSRTDKSVQDGYTPVTQSTPFPAMGDSAADDTQGEASEAPRQRIVFTDPVAFRYLEEDSSTMVLERHGRLEGYEVYLVEQWACSRVHPTFVINTYTGDPSHAVSVGVLSVPTNENAWSSRLRVYFKAVSQYHARRKDTPLGMLMVTNLSGFPSALTVIAVPDGDIKKHREDFTVNENLKRLGCSGRAGLTLSAPTGATQAKFQQLYRTSDRVPLYSAVLELVKLCQVALMIFTQLGAEYADGLLCDVTERAINDWWTQIGTEFYNLEPSDGILGPTTVAALLGMFMGARNRLNAYGAPVSKDAFDINSLKRGVAYFQKSQKLPKSRRLDRQTLDRLHRVTAKAASGEGWMVPKAVKSTVAELSGKGGEMVMGMVGAREKAGIGEIETLDIERFVQLVHGERSRWLWYGKPRKSLSNEASERIASEESLIFGKNNQGGYVWSGRKRDSFELEDSKLEPKHKDIPADTQSKSTPVSAVSVDTYGDRDQRGANKHKKHESRSGFGRIKDAVGISGLRSHHKHYREDESPEREGRSRVYQNLDDSKVALSPIKSVPSPSPPQSARQSRHDFSEKPTPIRTRMEEIRKEKDMGGSKSSAARSDFRSESGLTSRASFPFSEEAVDIQESTRSAIEKEASSNAADTVGGPRPFPDLLSKDTAVSKDGLESVVDDQQFSAPTTNVQLRRTQSHSRVSSLRRQGHHDNWWPRHLSFSSAEEAVLSWDEIGTLPDNGFNESDMRRAIIKEDLMAETARYLRDQIGRIEEQLQPWVLAKLKNVEALDHQAARDQEKLNETYYQHLDEYQNLRDYVQNLLASEKANMTDIIREIEVLGAKLEYELNTLSAKVQDVEDGVAEFERQVSVVEIRAQELAFEEMAEESWPRYIFRLFTGIGQPPRTADK